jgi:sugar lactone lactonase YvrE
MAFGPDGKLYAVATGVKQLHSINVSGHATPVTSDLAGNDITIRHDGNMYVTEPGNAGSRVWLIKPNGEKKVVDTGLKFANGITLSPDQSLLYVADYRSHWVYSYQIAADGTLQHRQKYYHLHVPDSADDSGADGMRTDSDGRLYVATHMGIQVCDQAGRVNTIIATPNKRVSNLCFGGNQFNIIYATCGDKVYSRKVKVRGSNSFEPPTKPKPPRL